MATTKIWSVKGRIDKVIDYAENIEKTTEQFSKEDMQCLRDVMDYAKNDFKTEKQIYVTGINCIKENAREDMLLTKEYFNKNGGILAFHSYQSFKGNEVTPEVAHEVGCEYAKKMWGDRFEVVVATHLNTDNCHNHFVINSVSFKDGLKFYASKATYREMRKLSDEVCREHRLSVIENPGKGRTKSYAELEAENEGRPTLRGFVRNDIDEAIAQSNTKDQFLNAMSDMGYTFDFNPNHKYPTLHKKGAARRFRFYSIGKGYDFEEILDRIYSKSIKRYPAPAKKLSYNKYFGKAERKGKLKGFQRIYVRFMFLMGIIPRNNPIKPTHPLIREAVLQMRKIQQEYKLLARNNITTDKQLLFFKNNREDRLNLLLEMRSENTRLIRNEKNENKLLLLRKKGKDLTEEITELKKEIKQCKNILTRSIKMEEDLQQISYDEKVDLKEEKQYEHIRRSR